LPKKRVYLDTSLLVAALVHESATAAVCSFLHHAEHDIWQVSRWVDAELASALAMQTRRGVISAIERDEAFTRYQILSAQRLHSLHIEAADYELAARLCLSEDAPLRAGDAVHLALCKRHNSCLVSLDKGLCRAARHHLVNVQEL